MAGEEQDVPVLHLALLIEEPGQSAGNGDGKGTALGKGLGRYKNQASVCPASSPVLGIEWHEILDVDSYERTPGCGSMSEYLLVGQREQSGVIDNCCCAGGSDCADDFPYIWSTCGACPPTGGARPESDAG
jgi:hypothetical protein